MPKVLYILKSSVHFLKIFFHFVTRGRQLRPYPLLPFFYREVGANPFPPPRYPN
ncbi:hypothetical protein Hanom_Chr09g00803251 [Helianthus anomalus]